MAKRARPSIPRIPATVKDPSLRSFLDKLREATEVNSGFQGDPADRAVTVRDLRDIGLVGKGQVLTLGDAVAAGEITGGGGVANPSPLDNSTPPSAPTGVYVTATTTKVFIGWDKPVEIFVAYTEVWKAVPTDVNPAPTRDDAWLVGTAPGVLFADAVEPLTTHYYWVRHVSHLGINGAWNSLTPTIITTPNTPENYLDLLTNQINSNHLSDVLAGRIDLIDLPTTGLVDRLAQETTDRVAAINAESTARINAINAEATTRAADIAAEANTRATDLANEVQARIDADANIQGQVDTLTINDSTNAGDISAILTRINAIGGSADDLESFYLDYDSFKTTVNNTEGNATAAYNKAVSVENRINQVDGGTLTLENFFTDYSTLNAAVTHGTTGLTATYNNGVAIKNRIDKVDGATKTVEQFYTDFNTLNLAVTHGTTGLSATRTDLTTVENRVNSVDGAGTTIEQLYLDFDAVELQVDDPTTGLGATYSKATTLENRINKVDGATKTIEQLYTDFNTLNLSVNHGTTGLAATRTDLTSLTNRVNQVDGGTLTLEQLYTQHNNLSLAVNHGTTGLTAAYNKGITLENRLNKVDGVSKTLEQLYSDYNTLQLAVNHGTTGLSATRTTATNATNRLNAVDGVSTSIESMWTSFDTLRSAVNHGTTGLSATYSRLGTAESRLDSTGTGRSIESIASDFLALEGTVNDSSLGLSATYNKAVTAQSTANNANGLATTVSNEVLTARGGEASLNAQLTQMKQVSTNLGALWAVTMDVNGYVSGFGVYNDGSTSLARFNVDQFAIGRPGATELSFVVDGTDTVMNGAYIQDATITNAKINDLTVDKLTGDKASFIAANIADGSITNAKIGNIIQSDSYIPGQFGWQINKLGEAEFNEITVHDPDGRVAFKTGETYLVTVDDPANDAQLWGNSTFTEFDDYYRATQTLIYINSAGYNDYLRTDANYVLHSCNQHADGYLLGDQSAPDAYFRLIGSAIPVGRLTTFTITAKIKIGNVPPTGSISVYASFYNGAAPNGNPFYLTNNVDLSINAISRTGGAQLIGSLNTFQLNANQTYTITGQCTIPAGTTYIGAEILKNANQAGGEHSLIVEELGLQGKVVQVSSTYIRDAAITEAKIQNAAIKTLKIDDGAVTALYTVDLENYPSSLWNSENFAYRNVFDVNFNHQHSETIPCLLSLRGTINDSARACTVRLTINGTIYYIGTSERTYTQGSGVGNQTTVTELYIVPYFDVIDVAPSGVNIKLDVLARTSNVIARNWNMENVLCTIQGIKK